MASVRVDNRNDPRFKVLGSLLGTNEYDALGRMVAVWDFCTEKHTYFLTETLVNILGNLENFCVAICNENVGLGEVCEQGIRIKGTKGRIEWLKKARVNGKKGGRPKKTTLKPEPNRTLNHLRTGVEPESNLLLGSSLLGSARLGSSTKELSEGSDVAHASSAPPAIPDLESPNNKARAFAAAYVTAYKTRFTEGRPEDLNDPKVRGQILGWIKSYPLERACQLIQVYFQMETKWFGTKGYDFITFRNNLNKVAQALDSGQDPDGNRINWGSIELGA